ncbi:CocE/NonD family hydrolase [Nocardioides sp. GXQ0305]|uniref:CocE/NonD family hydrolase n=1 Tax=Nocardioides sp. GXQ0305 TaxID=3423912 RepID=UPI003D7D3E68
MTGTTREVRIPGDGVDLAATLYLPDTAAGPQPCLLEALPYRKDDLTSSYAEGYLALRDRHGYAVCRLDLRGTGSSSGDPTDEYPPEEQRDLHAVIAWLAEQEWCDGSVGMFGTSYSGFNSLQMACERPPALGAVCAIYATDDRWTDDVHWRGGALRLVDLVDYCHYMTPMTVLPPVPAVWGEGWEEEWRRRLDDPTPWLFRWFAESRHGAYWNHGSVRLDGTTRGYDRIRCPVMLVAGWADGYRNNSFRTVAALADAGVPHRLLAGPWAHADPTTAMPGPRIDFDAELAAWFDTHLRGRGQHADRCDVFVRASTRPEPALDLHEGRWLTLPSVPPTTPTEVPLAGPRSLEVDPAVGTTAWIDCAGHLPWGLSTDQRTDDARSLTWDTMPPSGPVVGYPVARLRVSASAPAASLSVKVCDVFPDGTSALVSRGTLDLAFRESVHGDPSPLVPGEVYDVEVVLDACAYEWTPGQRLRVSVAGADWPNTVAPPAPVTLTVHEGSVTLPVLAGSHPTPSLGAGAEHSSESAEGVTWTITDEVLAGVTRATTRSVSTYGTPYDGTATEEYDGTVWVHRHTFEQGADATTRFALSWPGVDIEVVSTLEVRIVGGEVRATTRTVARRDGAVVSDRTQEQASS